MKTFSLILILFTISLTAFSQTEGTLTVEVTTSSTGGNYSPKNVVAIWIENENGEFIKTLMAYANNQKKHLNTWEASTSAAGSAYNVIDAITGATRTSHSTRSAYWDATGINGFTVVDGKYKVWMELTDKNGTGNFSSFEFEKGQDEVTLTPFNVPSFSSININWTPVISSVSETKNSEYFVYPNPATNEIQVSGKGIINVEIFDLTGKLLISTTHRTVDISSLSAGGYNVVIERPAGKLIKKLMVK